MKKRIGFFGKNRKGQIWVETVIYTLIALVMIGLILAFARPKIQELQDKAIIDQSITMMEEIDSIILDMKNKGEKRIIELGIKKGSLTIDGADDVLFFEVESLSEYSEPGSEPILISNDFFLLTQNIGSTHLVSITKSYDESYDIRFNGGDDQKELTKASIPHRLSVTNDGVENSETIINMELI